MSWYTWTRSIGNSPFGGEPIVDVDVLRLMTKGPGPAVRAGSLGGANKSSMLRCQMSSDACTLITRATPSFLNHAARVRTFCRTLCPGNDGAHPLSATTMSQNWRQVIEERSLCQVIGQRPLSALSGPNVPRAGVWRNAA